MTIQKQGQAQDRPTQLADAYEMVAKCDHYMIGIVERCTDNQREAAEQILIRRQNESREGSAAYKRLGRAIDLIAADRRTARQHSKAEFHHLKEYLDEVQVIHG